MVMDLLGPSLEDLFSHIKRSFSLKTVLLIADQIVVLLIIFLDSTHRVYPLKKPNTQRYKARQFLGRSRKKAARDLRN